MTSKPIIAVVTGTGAQGRAVCAAFLQSGRWQVRALTRDPNGPTAQRYADQGIEVVKTNFENKEEMVKAFTGAYAVYGVTIPPWHQAYSNTLSEFEQGVLQADSAKEAGVQLFLWSTLPYVGPAFKGLNGVEVYDSKANTNNYIMSIGLPAVFIGTPAFIDNVLSWPLIKWEDGGKRLHFWDYVVEKESPVAFLWVERDLGPSVLALADNLHTFGRPLMEHPLNHTLQPVASWRGTWGSVSRCIERLTGIPTSHEIMPNVDERWHPDLTKAFIYQNTHGLYPSTPFPPQTFLDLGVRFGTLEEFVKQKVVPVFGKQQQERLMQGEL